MKFFVTGVSGQLGHDVMNELAKRGYDGVGSDIQPEYCGVADGSAITDMPYVQLDITDKEAVKKVITEIKPDAVIHCAAWTAVDMAEDDDKVEKVRAVNAGGTQNIADVCKEIDCKMLYLSTDYVFDGQGTQPWQPDCKDYKPLNVYGQSKLPTGCETCSATMLLNFYGYKISETTFADKYLVKKPFGYSNGSYTGPDPNCAFVGTPYSSNSYGAYAPIMVKCMNKYLSDKSYKAVEISGKSLEYLSGKYVAQGQPIMVWATINMSPSFKTTTWRVNYTDENAKYKLGSYYTWTAGEHCLLLTGYDKDYYYFNDPWTNARTRYSKSLVNTRYNELGKQAVVMVKK